MVRLRAIEEAIVCLRTTYGITMTSLVWAMEYCSAQRVLETTSLETQYIAMDLVKVFTLVGNSADRQLGLPIGATVRFNL